MAAWIESGFPGPPPPETVMKLRPSMQKFMATPSQIMSKTAFPGGYELVEVSEPLSQ